MERVEDERLVRGLGRYVDDLDPPRVAHVAFARCPYPHARIVSIDASQARAIEGVLEVLLPDDVLGRTGPISILRPIPEAPRVMPYALPREIALYEGQPVVSVCADQPRHRRGRRGRAGHRLRAAAPPLRRGEGAGRGRADPAPRAGDEPAGPEPARRRQPRRRLRRVRGRRRRPLPHQPRQRPADGDARDPRLLRARGARARGRRLHPGPAPVPQAALRQPALPRGRHPRHHPRLSAAPSASSWGSSPRTCWCACTRWTSDARPSGSRTAWSSSAAPRRRASPCTWPGWAPRATARSSPTPTTTTWTWARTTRPWARRCSRA